jgi:gluconokinase
MIVIVAGVAGSGKTTIGSLLAARLGWKFEDADDLHPKANIAKMRAGVPLTDEDRQPWLEACGAWMDQRTAAGESAVIAVSALKRHYRDELHTKRPAVRLVFLHVDRATLAARLASRHGHFFRPVLLDSQLAIAETPASAEGDIVVDATGTPDVIVQEIIERLGLKPAG